MLSVKRVGILSFAKFQAVLFSLLGLVAGIIYAFGGLIFDLFTRGINVGSGLAMLAVLGMPLLFAAIGFFVGIVEAYLFNLLAGKFGGLELDIEG
jgi:hypothetical protein